jgi:hypothetical protein
MPNAGQDPYDDGATGGVDAVHRQVTSRER